MSILTTTEIDLHIGKTTLPYFQVSMWVPCLDLEDFKQITSNEVKWHNLKSTWRLLSFDRLACLLGTHWTSGLNTY